MPLISISRRVIFRRNDETSALLCAFVDRFYDIDQLLFVLQDPIHFVIVSGAEITHHVFIPEEEHERHRVVQLVHLVEIFDLFQIAYVDDSEVLDAICNAVEDFVLAHAVGVPVLAEADDNQAFIFGHDGLVHVPASNKVREDDGAHDGVR